MRYRRYRLSKRKNRRNFSRVARKIHKKNLYSHVARGGIRL